MCGILTNQKMSNYQPTETDIQAHDMMMEALTNIHAHLVLAQGWFDALMPLKKLVHSHDPAIMPQLVSAIGTGKIASKAMSKKLLRNDEAAVDVMFEHIGRSISKIASMEYDQRKEYLDKLNSLE